MQYHLNEGFFSLTGEEWLDNSINILRDEASGITVIISRGALPENSDFEKDFIVNGQHARADDKTTAVGICAYYRG